MRYSRTWKNDGNMPWGRGLLQIRVFWKTDFRVYCLRLFNHQIPRFYAPRLTSNPLPLSETATPPTLRCVGEMSRTFVLSTRVEFLNVLHLTCCKRFSLHRFLESQKTKNNLTPTYDLQRSRNRVLLISVSLIFHPSLNITARIYCRRNTITCLAFSGTQGESYFKETERFGKRTYFRRQPDCPKYDDSKLILWSLISA